MSLEPEEFKCKCCGKLVLDKVFLATARMARQISSTPYIISSGYRCAKHNREVGSTSRNHIEGKAMDIQARTNIERGKILKGLYLAGFTRVGIHRRFIHADSMDKLEACWIY